MSKSKGNILDPLEMIKTAGLSITLNPFGRKLNEYETINLISDADSLQKIKSKISGKIGIISGASTPELIVQQIITSLNANEITEIQVQEENINFTLPKIK